MFSEHNEIRNQWQGKFKKTHKYVEIKLHVLKEPTGQRRRN